MNRPMELSNCSRVYISGIYQIKNLINGKAYIGSSNHLYRRYSDHVRHLSRNEHTNPKLQSSWNKHGMDNFEFSILEFCSIDVLVDREQWYIDNYVPYFNIAREVGIPNTPKAGTPEAKARSKKNLESRKNSKWCNSDEFHEMLSGVMVDRWKNPEYKSKRSNDTKSLWNNEEYRKKQSISHSKLSPLYKSYIKRLKELGYKTKYIMEAFGVSHSTVDRIYKGIQ